MKLTTFLFFLAITQVVASEAYSQTTKMTLQLKGVAVKQVLDQIEEKSEFFFLYNSKLVDISRKVSVDAKDERIDEILNNLFQETGVVYTVVDRQIVLTNKADQAGFISQGGQQQGKKVNGKVTDSNGGSLPGVSVVVKGTTTGVITDNSGNYSLSNIPENATLQFSFVGMKMQEVAVTGKTSIDIVLVEDAIGIDEVVAIGYGTQKKRELIGSISSIKSADLEKVANSTNFTSVLQGQAAGVSVQSSSGALGAGVKILVRGLSSISASTEPLYIVDGVPIFSSDMLGQSPMSLINPSDIESVQVLKDAAATSIYGSRGSNGVILITTKTGTAGKISVNVNYDTGISDLPLKQVNVVDSKKWFEIQDLSKSYLNPNTPYDINNDYYATMSYQTEKLTRDEAINTNTDWKKALLQRGSFHNLNFSVVGGDKLAKYFISGNYRKDRGIMQNQDMDRYGIRTNLDLSPTDNFKVGTKINLSMSKKNNSGGTFNQINTMTFTPVHSKINPNLYWNPLGGNPAATNDPQNLSETTGIDRALIGFYAEYSFPFLKGLSARTEISMDYLQAAKNHYESATIRPDGNTYDLDNSQKSQTTNSNFYFTYDKKFKNHNLNLVYGVEGQKTAGWTRNMEGKKLVGPFQELGTPNLITTIYSGLGGENYRLAYFGRANYNYKSRYFAGFSMRRDGSSIFTDDFRWGTFMAFSAGWIISDEQFMGDFGKKNFLKLRGSFGQTGNANIPAKLDGSGYNTGLAYGSIDLSATNGTSLSSIGVGNLTWETTSNKDVGVDFGFFNNRINGSLAYYNKYVRDLLLAVALPPSSGVTSSSIWNNVGDLVNRGVELSVTSVNVNSKKFSWETTLNMAFNHNEVKRLTPQIDQKGTGMVGNSLDITKVGYGIRDYYLCDFAGVDPQTGLSMIYKRDPDVYSKIGETVRLKDANGNYVLIMANAANQGNNLFHFKNQNRIPKYYGGITNKFEYKGFDFSFLVTFSGGNYIYDMYYRQAAVYPQTGAIPEEVYNNLWRQPGDNTKYMRILWGNNGYPDPVTGKPVSFGDPRMSSSQFLYKGDFVKLKSFTFGYTLPPSVAKSIFKDLRVYASVDNLYTFSKYPGWDPEGQEIVSTGVWQIPQPFSVSLGVSVKF